MIKETMRMADYFTGIYPVSKTLRFELKPVGRTQEYIEKQGILDDDFQRAEDYKAVKKIIDRYHKYFIDEALRETRLQGLKEYRELYDNPKRSGQENKQFEIIQSSLRKQVVGQFTSHKLYKTLFSKELIKDVLIEYTQGNPEEQELIKKFGDFTSYFTGFHQNRQNMYSNDAKSTAISYRLIHQNLPKFIDNMKVFSALQKTSIIDCLPELMENLKRKVNIDSIEKYFDVEGYNDVLTQSGIDIYNTILGGYSIDENTKIEGLNEYINLYNQEQKEKMPKFKPLFKQILSDREKVSFISDQFETDEEVVEAVKKFYISLRQNILENEDNVNVGKLLQELSRYNLDKIYLKNDTFLTMISKDLFDGNWALIGNAVQFDYDSKSNTKNKQTAKYAESREKNLSKVKNYTIGELNVIVETFTGNGCHIEEYFEKKIGGALEKIHENYETCRCLHREESFIVKSLGKDEKAVSEIKDLLDSVKELQWLLKPLLIGQEESDKDEVFYAEFLHIWEEIDLVTPLYNKVRNYVTRKPYSLEKIKLNFYRSTLMDGWDKNKEKDNLGIILEKEGLYYLGIMNKTYNKAIDDAPESNADNGYRKMEYKLLPGPNKMLPKVFFAKSRIDEFAPDSSLQEHYKEGTHKKGKNFDLSHCHELIDFFKQSINRHEDWSKFDFHFSDTESYEDISGFYREVEHQGYKIAFRPIDQKYIDDLVDSGKLYLFQIYNKDFSPYSKGAPNLHTLYWKMLFAPENLQNVAYKLNGQAEIFYRKASIRPEDIVRHEADKPILNRDPLEGKVKSVFPYDLIKDRRFTCDKYQFHVPITMNFQAEGESRLNQKVRRVIHEAENLHVIGIDRGERNLLYLSLIDMQGKIIKQMSLNSILSYDSSHQEHERNYHWLLKAREDENKKARQSWQTINSIKELKEGYLSQVIHVITDWMISYNAIVVMEDLNFGFKRGRQKFERQVYQKFEKMLIDKLNFLVDKKKEPQEKGGLLQAYQLTERFESFQKLGKQSGFLFYIPAWNTSKLDPATGFVNLFNTKYESIESSRNFIGKFGSISYNADRNYFEFAFDYSKFTHKAEGSRQNWIACTQGGRIETYRNPDKNSEWDTRNVDLTKEMKVLLKEYHIDITENDMCDAMMKIDKADFYKRFMHLFSLLMQMRNSDAQEDKMTSPILNAHGEFFTTGSDEHKPLDADANGAYNIARKGLWIVEQIKNTDIEQLDKVKLAISNKEWLKYAQEHTL